jgi:hypothetical protein
LSIFAIRRYGDWRADRITDLVPPLEDQSATCQICGDDSKFLAVPGDIHLIGRPCAQAARLPDSIGRVARVLAGRTVVQEPVAIVVVPLTALHSARRTAGIGIITVTPTGGHAIAVVVLFVSEVARPCRIVAVIVQAVTHL